MKQTLQTIWKVIVKLIEVQFLFQYKYVIEKNKINFNSSPILPWIFIVIY
jgi:hypothetical protein